MNRQLKFPSPVKDLEEKRGQIGFFDKALGLNNSYTSYPGSRVALLVIATLQSSNMHEK